MGGGSPIRAINKHSIRSYEYGGRILHLDRNLSVCGGLGEQMSLELGPENNNGGFQPLPCDFTESKSWQESINIAEKFLEENWEQFKDKNPGWEETR